MKLPNPDQQEIPNPKNQITNKFQILISNAVQAQPIKKTTPDKHGTPLQFSVISVNIRGELLQLLNRECKHKANRIAIQLRLYFRKILTVVHASERIVETLEY